MSDKRLDALRIFIRRQANLTDGPIAKPGPGECRLNHAEAIEVANFLDGLADVFSRAEDTENDLAAGEKKY